MLHTALLDAPPVAAPRHHPTLPLRVGTRASPLALQQTRHFLDILTRVCPVLKQFDVFQEHVIRTTGDAVQNRRLSEIGGKGLFSKEIHEAMLDRRIDLAVHSLKDLETELPEGLALGCVLAREDCRDALILGDECGPPVDGDPFAGIPCGALIGTSSVRRQAQLLHHRPDLRITMLRGNVQARLDKIRHGVCTATMLAYAGLRRLGLEHEASVVLKPSTMLPAACQGIVGITVREDATELRSLLRLIADPVTLTEAAAERALLSALDGTCSTPAGALTEWLDNRRIRLHGLIASIDGQFLRRETMDGDAADAAAIGTALGNRLRQGCPAGILA